MRRMNTWISAMLVLAVAAWSGCGPSKPAADKGSEKKPKEQGGAAHDHDHGPSGGEIVKLQSKEAKGDEYHAEWVTDDDAGKLTIWILDKSNKKEVGIDAEVLSIDVKDGKEVDKKILKAANLTAGDMPTATRFEVVDQAFLTVLANKEVDATIRVSINGAEHSGKIVHHEHHH